MSDMKQPESAGQAVLFGIWSAIAVFCNELRGWHLCRHGCAGCRDGHSAGAILHLDRKIPWCRLDVRPLFYLDR